VLVLPCCFWVAARTVRIALCQGLTVVAAVVDMTCAHRTALGCGCLAIISTHSLIDAAAHLVPLCACCSDKVRDQLVSMWDRKTMGDMPKVVKHLAAAAAAEKAAAAAGTAKQQHQQQHQQSQQQQRSKPRNHSRPPQQADVYYSDDSDFQDRGATSHSSYSLSDSDTERGAARRKSKKQRKRSFVPMSSDAFGRQAKRHTSNGQAAASQQAYRWQQYSNGGRVFDLPAPSGTGLQQWLHPGQPGVQQPRTAIQRQPTSQPGICTLAPLQLPEMPRAPR
jgi:hypothetical protein